MMCFADSSGVQYVRFYEHFYFVNIYTRIYKALVYTKILYAFALVLRHTGNLAKPI